MRSQNDIIIKCEENGIEVKRIEFDGMFCIWGKRTIIASWGGGWEHVSLNDWNITPSWEDMCKLKDIFWGDEECVVQYHPPKSDYVNNLQHCLHLWKPIEQYSGKLPIPDSLLVGIKGLEFDKEGKRVCIQECK